MNQAYIEEIVKAWIPLLGLTHWEIRMLWGKEAEDEFDNDIQNAAVWRSKDYDRARIAVDQKEYKSWTVKEANQHIVHELLHLVMRDVEFSIDHVMSGYLAPDVEKVWVDQFRHAIEGAIDRLAYRFVEIAGAQ